MITRERRSLCPVAGFLDVLGDRWTMLVVRDLLLGASKHKDFLASLEGIPTNILADRLKRLEGEGLVDKTAYQDKPVRYTYALTPKGKDLAPLMQEMVKWWRKYNEDTPAPTPGD